MEYYISEYWVDELKNNKEVDETIDLINEATRITYNIIEIMNEKVYVENNEVYEQFKTELVKAGTNNK